MKHRCCRTCVYFKCVTVAGSSSEGYCRINPQLQLSQQFLDLAYHDLSRVRLGQETLGPIGWHDGQQGGITHCNTTRISPLTDFRHAYSPQNAFPHLMYEFFSTTEHRTTFPCFLPAQDPCFFGYAWPLPEPLGTSVEIEFEMTYPDSIMPNGLDQLVVEILDTHVEPSYEYIATGEHRGTVNHAIAPIPGDANVVFSLGLANNFGADYIHLDNLLVADADLGLSGINPDSLDSHTFARTMKFKIFLIWEVSCWQVYVSLKDGWGKDFGEYWYIPSLFDWMEPYYTHGISGAKSIAIVRYWDDAIYQNFAVGWKCSPPKITYRGAPVLLNGDWCCKRYEMLEYTPQAIKGLRQQRWQMIGLRKPFR